MVDDGSINNNSWAVARCEHVVCCMLPKIRRFTPIHVETGHNKYEAQMYGMDCKWYLRG